MRLSGKLLLQTIRPETEVLNAFEKNYLLEIVLWERKEGSTQ